MSYLVLARKWRPGKFSEVVGQEHVTETLKNAIKNNRIVQAFLFTGVRGVGKTTIARILAKALNCQSAEGPSEEPCGECTACREIGNGSAVDVQEIDGASNNSVDDVRNLRENAQYMPSSLRYKVFIIDEVHMLSRSAFNALLKILEEPPAHVIFMFATTDPQKIPVTILSRCQRYDLKRLKAGQIGAQIRNIAKAEGFELDDNAVKTLAAQADGSMRDALSLLDQVVSFAGTSPTSGQVREILGAVDRELIMETVLALLEHDSAAVLESAHKALDSGCSEKAFLGEVAVVLRNLAVAAACPSRPDLLDLEEEEAARLGAMAKQYSQRAVHLLFDAAGRGLNELAYSSKPGLTLEMTLLRMLHALPLEPLDKVIEDVDYLLKNLPVRSGESPAAVSKKNFEKEPEYKKENIANPQRDTGTINNENADSVEQNWVSFLNFLGQKGDIAAKRLASVLEHASLAALSESEIKLVVQKEFHKEEIQRRRKELEQYLSGYFGRPVALNLTLSATVASKPIAEKKAEDRKKQLQEKHQRVLRHPNVLEVQEILGGKVMEVKFPEEDD
ncbi:MAG: DNA polymerase III subunit gamma/tau [Deltaproteobacteria bacterium]|nr:DNA polymerase III subunit gamma/tau [Deltaproteobacteria bacterium]